MTLGIKIDQSGKPSGTGKAREDLVTGTAVTLTALGGPYGAYKWTVLHRPADVLAGTRATAVLSASTSSVTTLSPIDVRGTYLVQLAVDSGAGLGTNASDIARLTFYAGLSGDARKGTPSSNPRTLPRRMPAAGEKAEHNVPDAIDASGNIDGWAREMSRWELVWQDSWNAKFWAAGRVDLDGSGATLVRGYNIEAVTRTASGVVLVEFTVAMPDASYSVLATPRDVGGQIIVSSELAASCVIERADIAGVALDAPFNFRVEMGVDE